MKKLFVLLCTIFLAFVLTDLTEASIVNGSFEDGLNAWYPLGGGETAISYTLYDGNTLVPMDGDYFAINPGTNNFSGGSMFRQYGIYVEEGSVLSGYVAMEVNAKVPENLVRGDYLKVKIDQQFGDGNTWTAITIDKNDMTNYGYVIDEEIGYYRGYITWTDWSWTAPATGNYNIVLETWAGTPNITTSGDIYYFTHGLFDNIRISTVPVPGAVWLFGSGLFGLVGFRRKYKK
jgi:PEP-CTERM motif